MRYARFLALAVTAGLLFQVDTVQAQGRGDTSIPAEFPPASYNLRQYVDSRGCVYVRAGIDGSVDWVPRVTRAREHLCGAQPTLAVGAPTGPAATVAPPAPRVVQITPDPEPAARVGTAPQAAPAPMTAQTTAPTPAPRVIAAPAPQLRAVAPRPRTNREPMRTVASIPAQPRVVTPPPQQILRAAPAPQPAPRPAQIATSCPNASASAQPYMRSTSGVRCGPQTAPHVTIVRRGEAPSAGKNVYRLQPTGQAQAVTGETRIVPRHVYEGRDDQVVTVPKGYRAAFEDDRLNRARANQSVNGYKATQLVWTNTVPRRLIDRRTGRDVRAKHPKLIYPYTDMATQNAALSTKGYAQPVAPPSATRSVAAQPAPRLPAAAVQGRFVQVGTFGVAANAERTARQLQSLGLPVRYGQFNKGGKSYRTVLAGPFASGNDLNAALVAARRAGFGDAFVR